MGRLLLVDDDPDLILAQIQIFFGASQHKIDVARTGEEGIRSVAERAPDVVLLDLRLPDLSGLDVYRHIRQIDARIPVIFITAATEAHHAIEAMKQGAYDYLFKPLDIKHLRRVVGRGARALAADAASPPSSPRPPRGGTRRRDHRPLPRHARGLQGDRPRRRPGRHRADHRRERHRQGTGRPGHLPAQRAGQGPVPGHQLRRHPRDLLESELFGHEKGAFTGAERRRIGKFEQCSGGTLFLDEIGDMPLATQTKLLRLLQEQAFERVGGNETIQTDVRLIAATNRDLEDGCGRGKFPPRPVLPPERLHDPAAALARARRRPADAGPPLCTPVQPGAGPGGPRGHPRGDGPAAQLPLAGNIRELQSVLKQALLQVTGPVVTAESLPTSVSAYAVQPRAEKSRR